MRNFLTTTLLLLAFSAHSNQRLDGNKLERDQKKIEIYFDQGSYAVTQAFKTNKDELSRLSKLLNSLIADENADITKISVDSYASPEGDVVTNNRLSKKRAEAVCEYIKSICTVPPTLIESRANGVAWQILRDMVEQSDLAYKQEVLAIIDNVPVETWAKVSPTDKWEQLVDSRNNHLMDLKGGVPYREMYENMFSQLPRSSIVTVYYEIVKKEAKDDINGGKEAEKSENSEEIVQNKPLSEQKELTNTNSEAIAQRDKSEKMVAIKSNLLYDVVLIPNIEVELPINNKYSIAAEWIFPWWVTKDNGNALQLLSGQVEGRYWFGDRENRAQLTGLYAGLYAGGGLYDLQWKNNGYQGEFYIAAGLSGGYAHTINKSGTLRMEYSLGLGYLNTKYRYYDGKQNNEYLVWQHDGRYSWVGPTKIEASLVWFLSWKKERR